MSEEIDGRLRGGFYITCAACKDVPHHFTVSSDLDSLGETMTFAFDCHGAREMIEWKPLPALVGPVVATAFLDGEPPLSHLGEWRRL